MRTGCSAAGSSHCKCSNAAAGRARSAGVIDRSGRLVSGGLASVCRQTVGTVGRAVVAELAVATVERTREAVVLDGSDEVGHRLGVRAESAQLRPCPDAAAQ